MHKGPFILIDKSVRKTIEMAGIVGVISLLGLMMMTVSDVLMRFFLNKPMSGSAEITGYLMVSTGFLGLAWCALRGGHITIDLLASKFSKRGLAVTDTVNYMIVIGLSILLAWQGYVQSINMRKMNVVSVTTGIPTYPFYLLVAFGFLLLLLAAVILLVPSVRRIKK